MLLPGSKLANKFLAFDVPFDADLFVELFDSVKWEDVGKGRQGAVLAKVDEVGGVPLVRTTTQYGSPTQRFQAVHERLARQIQERLPHSADFNNALIETYTNAYTTMGSHSDQALDLADDSFIAVLSCYRHPDVGPLRKLLVESKDPVDERLEIPLVHNGVVAFSVAANRRLKHKIVLDAPGPEDNQWLGVTFRTSKTVVRYRDGRAYLPSGTRLTSADDDQRREFYQLRRRENNETGFTYPDLAYTISDSDLTPPV